MGRRRMSRLLAAVLVMVLAATLPAGVASAGAPPLPPLEVGPLLVLPGDDLAVSGPSPGCDGGLGAELTVVTEDYGSTDVPVVSVPDDVPVEALIPIPADTPMGIYRVILLCDYGEFSQGVATGWAAVADENGLPPVEGEAVCDTNDLTWNDPFEISGDGFAPDSEVLVWMYSDPVLLGTATAAATGAAIAGVVMPPGTSIGAHTMVLAGRDDTGRPRFLAAGVVVGERVTPLEPTTTVAAAPVGATPTTGAAAPAAATAAAPAAATLPATGSNLRLATLAVLLIAVGGLVVWRTRRVRR